MGGWAWLTLGIALVAAFIGYGGIIGGLLAMIARVVFWIFVVLFLVTLFSHLRYIRQGRPA